MSKKATKPGRTNLPELYVSSLPDLAEFFGLSVSGIRDQLARKAPAKTDRGYDLAAWQRWRRAQDLAGDGESTADAKRRYAVAHAELEEIRLGEKRGELVTVQHARERRSEVLRWAVAVMERAPSELYSLLAGQPKTKIRGIVKGYFSQIRRDTFGSAR